GPSSPSVPPAIPSDRPAQAVPRSHTVRNCSWLIGLENLDIDQKSFSREQTCSRRSDAAFSVPARQEQVWSGLLAPQFVVVTSTIVGPARAAQAALLALRLFDASRAATGPRLEGFPGGGHSHSRGAGMDRHACAPFDDRGSVLLRFVTNTIGEFRARTWRW